MKKVLLMFILIFLNCSAFSQTSTYYRRYNIPGMQGGLGIVETDDGGFVGIGQHEGNGSSGDCDIYAYKVDACGNLQWMKLIGTASQEGGKSIYKRSNGNLLLVGLYSNAGFLIELDFNGNLIWEKRFSGLLWTLAITEDNIGNIYVTGTNGGTSYIVLKCDAIGNVIWSKSYNDLGTEPHSIVFLGSNKLLVFSTYNVPNGDFGLNCIDSNGNIIWSKSYGGAGYSDADHNLWGGKAILDQTKNNVFVISQTELSGNDNILLSKIEASNGNAVWSRIIGDGGSDQPRDLALTSNGIAVLGNSNGYSAAANSSVGITAAMNERDILLVKIDDFGNKIWSHTYGAEERDKGVGLRHNDDGTFLISAYTSSPFFGNTDASMDPLFIRTDSLGLVSCQVNSPNVSVQNHSINSAVSGVESTVSISSSSSNSNVIDYVPIDGFQCLSCSTVPVFVPSDTIVCVNETVYFFNTTSVGLKCFQSWYIDSTLVGGYVDTLSYTFSEPGDYPVLLYSNCGASTDTFSINIHVDPIPILQFTVNNNCINDTSKFSNISTISSGSVITYYWDFKDNTIDSVNFNTSHFYSNYGTYNVTLSAISDLGCYSSISNPVTIMPLPTANFSSTSVCPGQPTNFLDQSLPGNGNVLSNWIWNFGDSSVVINGGPSTSHIYSSPGYYSATLTTITSNGCKDDTTITVMIKDKPIANFNAIGPFCLGAGVATSNLSSTPSGTNMNFYWDFGNSISSTLPNPITVFADTGNYPIELFVYATNGCLDSISKLVFINPNPIPNIVIANPCVETNLQLLGTTPSNQQITNWFWNLGSGVTSNQQNIINSYTNSGTYYPYLRITDINGCKEDTSIQVVLYDNPNASFQFLNKCDGDSIEFNDLSVFSLGDTINSWIWDFGDGIPYNINSNSSPNYLYNTYNDYIVSLQITSQHGCLDSVTNTISVYPNPKVNFISDSVCYLNNTKFSNLTTIPSGYISNWSWDFGDNKFSNAISPIHFYNQPGNKNVKLKATSNFGCLDSTSKQAVVWYLPNPNVQILDTAICQDFKVRFTDKSFTQSGIIDSWLWDFENGNSSVDQNPNSYYYSPGIFDVNLTVTTNLGCKNDTTFINAVQVYPLPIAEFIYNPMNASVYMPELFFYDQSVLAAHWNWDFGDFSNSNLKDPIHRFNAGNYKVELIVESEFGCLDTTFKYIDVKDDYALWIPNTFSPNDDGKNDLFFVNGFGVTEIHLSIYSRWGDLIFSSSNEIEGWNGLINGQRAQEDVYIYRVDYKDVLGGFHDINGRVNLIR